MPKTIIKKGNIDRSDAHRALLTDTSPADVPIVFSNDGFHANLRRQDSSPEMADIVGRLIRQNHERYTIPYRYRIRQSNTASRLISLVHPAAQSKAAEFYGEFGHLIPYFCRHTAASLRRPEKIGSSVSRLTRASGKKRYKGAAIDTLLQDQSVRNPGSFFAYAGYDRFYRFFGSAEFTALERSYSQMRITDVAKCFSSIYSHTLAWAVKDVEHGKESGTAHSFANSFDSLMQFSNYNETNGIPVGAEISRIFSEIILQAVDTAVIRKAGEKGLVHGRDFQVRRYIDDYAIFCNSVGSLDKLQIILSDQLAVFNLHLNEAKTYTVQRPLQTKKSQVIAHSNAGLEKFRNLISIRLEGERGYAPNQIRRHGAISRSLIEDIKVACADSGANYEDVAPYIIGSVASIAESLITSYKTAGLTDRSQRGVYLPAIQELMRTLYFFLSVHLTVPSSYQVAKTTILALRFFSKELPELHPALQETVRTQIYDFIHDPILLGLEASNYVPVEILNIVLAANELSHPFRIDMEIVAERIISNPDVDYFSIVSLLFYHRGNSVNIVSKIEKIVTTMLIPSFLPRKRSSDAHFMLDLICCPYLGIAVRMKLINSLYKNLEIALGSVASRQALLAEFQANPWFVNWTQIDLLNHLRKKELSTTY